MRRTGRAVWWRLGSAVLLLSSPGRLAAEDQEPPDPTDWPAMIARLQQEASRQPGLEHTRQQLAIAYNNYGVSLSNQGRWDAAVQQLEEALRVDPTNSKARENLSRIHLNRAHDAHKRHQEQEALDALERTLQLDPQCAQAYALRGEIEYGNQKLKEAKASWQQSLQLDPTQTEIQKRLNQVRQELPVESEFERLSQASFDVRYQEGLERAIGFDVRDALLEARRDVGTDFAYWPKHRLVVLVYSAESFRKLRQETPDWVGGQFDGKIRVPLPNGQMNPQMVKQILFHEYTHAVVYDLTNGNCPIWFNEGLAEYEGRRQLGGSLIQLVRAYDHTQVIPWKELSDRFSVALTAEAVSLAYQESYSIVTYLTQRYGMWRIRRLLKAIQEGQGWEAAFEDEYHLKLKTLETSWQGWLPEFLKRQSPAA